jgi:hypothetical protein
MTGHLLYCQCVCVHWQKARQDWIPSLMSAPGRLTRLFAALLCCVAGVACLALVVRHSIAYFLHPAAFPGDHIPQVFVNRIDLHIGVQLGVTFLLGGLAFLGNALSARGAALPRISAILLICWGGNGRGVQSIGMGEYLPSRHSARGSGRNWAQLRWVYHRRSHYHSPVRGSATPQRAVRQTLTGAKLNIGARRNSSYAEPVPLFSSAGAPLSSARGKRR